MTSRGAVLTSAAIILSGCGGNVVVDGVSSRGVGGAGVTSASSGGGAGGATASSSSGAGAGPAIERWHVLGAASEGGAFEDPLVALDASGDIFVAASFSPGPGTLSTLPLSCPLQAILIAGIAPDGTIRWAKCASDHQVATGAALALAGITASAPNQVMVLATFEGELEYDGQVVGESPKQISAILMTLDPATGDVIATLLLPNDPGPWGFAGDAGGGLYLAGLTGGTFDFGGLSLTANPNEQSLFVAKIDSAGAGAWITEVAHSASTLPEGPVRLSVSTGGSRVALVTTFQGTADFGPATENDSLNPLLVELDAASGFIDYGLYPAGASQRGDFAGASFDGEDNLVVSGTAFGPLDLGAGTFLPSGGANFLVNLDPTGNVIWQRELSPYAGQGPFFLPVAVNQSGDVAYALTMDTGSLSVSGSTVACPSTAGACSVIGSIAANGAPGEGVDLLAGAFQPITSAVAVSAEERIVAGTFKDWIDFGKGQETHPPAGVGLFIAGFPP